jgi:hypothetical protein
MALINKTDEELKQIAKDIFHGHIFCDRHLRAPSDLERVFAVIALGGLKDLPKEDVLDIGLIYEYREKSSPVGINGYPMFFSAQFISKNDATKVFDYHKKLKDLENSL